MELWDLYTEDRKLTPESHIRGEELPENRYHLVVHVWIKNKNNEYLISQRDSSRPTFPLMWECTGGSVLKGETSLQGALREVKEELGIDLLPQNGRLIGSKVRKIINGKKFNDIKDVWLFNYDGEVSLKNATTNEVCDFKWMKPYEIQKLLNDGKLVCTLSYFFDKVLNFKY